MTSVALASVPDGRLTILKALQVPTALRSKPSLSDCRVLLFTSSLARWGTGLGEQPSSARERSLEAGPRLLSSACRRSWEVETRRRKWFLKEQGRGGGTEALKLLP